jgi:hypothetical protein
MKIVEIISEDFGSIANSTLDALKNIGGTSASFAPDSLGWSLGGSSPKDSNKSDDDNKDTTASSSSGSSKDSPSDPDNDGINRNIVVIGDSIAVGIAAAGHADSTYCKGGQDTSVILGYVKDFIKTGKAKNSLVILSSGASNSTYERPNGEKKDLDSSPISQQLSLLRNAGARVALVGTGSQKSKTITNKYGSYFVNFAGQRVNQTLAAAAYATGSVFLGPLENYDSNMDSGKGDGIHPFGGYSKLYQAGAKLAQGSGGSGAGSSNGKPGKGVAATGSSKDAVKFFMSKGWTKEQAAGIVGNLQAESGANLQTNIVGDGGQAYGIAQWHLDRQAKFKRVFGKDIRNSSFQEQLEFVQWELEHDESTAGGKIKQTTTAKAAAAAMDQYYERSSGQHRDTRIANANNLAGATYA